MIGIFFALLSALAYGFSVVLVRKRLDESNLIPVALVITAIGNIILWPFALIFTNLKTINIEGVLFFAIAGLIHPGIGRLLYYKGMKAVGVSINASIFATYPMYTSILAVFFLGDVLTSENWIGIICIVIGVVFIEKIISKPEAGPKGILRKGLVFPLFTSLIVAFGHVVRKQGLNIYNEPLLGVAIGYSLSLLLYLFMSISSHTTRSSVSLGRDFRLFWKAGVGLSLGWVLFYYALSLERVSIITPIKQTEPLFILFFTYLYLKELERISFKLIITTLLIVIGVLLVSIG